MMIAHGSLPIGRLGVVAVADAPIRTADRLVASALAAFAERGYEAASLDQIAVDCGVRKQTLLYHFPSKEALLEAVIRHTVDELADRLREAGTHGGDPRRAMVDALFRVGSERPELLELVREALKLGPPASDMLLREAGPFLDQLAAVMPRDKVLGAGAMILGMATEVEALAAVGVPPSLAELRRRRRSLLDYVGG